jgi:periplasmic copper chaperone A
MTMRKTFLIGVAAAASTAMVVVAAATAHVGTNPGVAPAGQTSVIGFTVGHGCEGSPTRSVSIRIAAGVTSAKPRLKPGWRISIKSGTLPQPVKDFDGNTVTRGVLEVTWSGGKLPDAYYDTFELRLGMPNKPGRMLYFPTVQRCAKGVHRWVTIPKKGQPEPEEPAPGVMLVKSSGGHG